VKPARIRFPGLAVILLGLGCWGGRCGENPQGWELAWSDEFNGGMGESPFPAKWRFDVGTDWGNDQLEYDTARPENVSMDGEGHLVITARQESYLGRLYTSARINTQGYFDQARGRFEARIQLPVGQGLWPAFWLLGANFETVGWPQCGEIDIMEYRGQEPSVVHGSLHGPGYSGGRALTGRYALSEGSFHDGFHVFSVEWGDAGITWYVDDVPYQTLRAADLPSGTPWVFDHPFFIILNVAVGGNYVGSPDQTTTFPQRMLVDWVRVYRLGP
jgi:beta-glucanase (GH16 family)